MYVVTGTNYKMSNVQINNEIRLNHDLLLQHLDNTSLLIKTFQEEFQLVQSDDKLNTKYLSVASLDTIVHILDHFVPIAIHNRLQLRVEHPELDILEQIYKSLRNCLINGLETQHLVLNNVRLMSHTRDLLTYLLDFDENVSHSNLSIVLQFLCNLIVLNTKAQIWVWNYFQNSVLKSLLREKVAHIGVMIIYNICKENDIFLPNDINFVCTLLTLMSKNVDNVEYLLDLLLEKNIITNIYDDFDTDTRILLLGHFRTLNITDTIKLPIHFILLLVEHFKTKSDCILKTVEQYLKKIEPFEVSQLLELIASVSHKDTYMRALQNDQSLLINVAFLLKSIHEFGKLGDNHFSAIQKLSELTNANAEVQDHPGFGFKASLIRLLANLSWNHQKNQDLVRELDCIPLLMDCCNMDARNPLIIQWVILAIRNLCENNETNQSLIAKMSKVGVVDSAIIREMGLTLNQDGDTNIGIVPLHYK